MSEYIKVQDNAADTAVAALAAANSGSISTENNDMTKRNSININQSQNVAYPLHDELEQSPMIDAPDNETDGDNKRYVCEHCKQYFTRKHNLKSHLLIHTTEKPFRCTECGQTFRRGYDLKRHRKTHTKEKPYTCKHCGKGFARADALLRHLHSSTGCSTSAAVAAATASSNDGRSVDYLEKVTTDEDHLQNEEPIPKKMKLKHSEVDSADFFLQNQIQSSNDQITYDGNNNEDSTGELNVMSIIDPLSIPIANLSSIIDTTSLTSNALEIFTAIQSSLNNVPQTTIDQEMVNTIKQLVDQVVNMEKRLPTMDPKLEEVSKRRDN
ncbi:hypothetical protein DAMA08_032040 [Martiniozyma asiatica (nom. inval.)]|nr:hypothetical protein DAMA08_032040 [Martiniozyma asiatica]